MGQAKRAHLTEGERPDRKYGFRGISGCHRRVNAGRHLTTTALGAVDHEAVRVKQPLASEERVGAPWLGIPATEGR